MEILNIRQSEMRILEILWSFGDMPASELHRILAITIDWKKSTTYTVLKKCHEKGFVERIEPDYICRATISLEEIQKAKITELLQLYFYDSKDWLVDSLRKEFDI